MASHLHTNEYVELAIEVQILETCRRLNDVAVMHLAAALLAGVTESSGKCQSMLLGDFVLHVHLPTCAEETGVRLALANALTDEVQARAYPSRSGV